ncbi:hypothetical protein ACKWRH_33695 [Bradyrhizobium sp. Pa8]|uniref:hypothetical protein n=1 Tax=Bradyrhizobium sp. Pa8 TaxID=3386552 RepID=UPI00403F0F2D
MEGYSDSLLRADPLADIAGVPGKTPAKPKHGANRTLRPSSIQWGRFVRQKLSRRHQSLHDFDHSGWKEFLSVALGGRHLLARSEA